MSTSSGVSRTRPLIVGAVIGLVIGAAIGLAWAWLVQPAFYAGGAYPSELTKPHQKAYVKAAVEAYMTTRDVRVVKKRLDTFSAQDKVRLLAETAKDFSSNGRSTEATLVGDLAAALMNEEGWSVDDMKSGLTAAGATEEFSSRLGLVPEAPQPQPGATQPQPATPETEGKGISLGRILLIVLVIILALVVVAFLLTRIKPKRKPKARPIPQDMILDDGSRLKPLRQWVGTYTMGQDNYDESFTVETPESDFLGECGMGILDGFASGSPKKVLAFDVWLFDKTDIRTISVPVMSKWAFEDEMMRGKLQPDTNPVLAAEGSIFSIETTALTVRAKIEEVAYGEGPPDMSYFTTLKISLSAYLKPDVDVSGSMPVPEGYA